MTRIGSAKTCFWLGVSKIFETLSVCRGHQNKARKQVSQFLVEHRIFKEYFEYEHQRWKLKKFYFCLDIHEENEKTKLDHPLPHLEDEKVRIEA